MAFITSSALSATRAWIGNTRGPQHCARRTTRAARSARRCDMSETVHPEALQLTWPRFADHMGKSGEVPPISDWHVLFDGCVRANDKPSTVVWLLSLMKETGVKPTAVTYEKCLEICQLHDDRVAAFHLIEFMFEDKILLGDVELPDGMEATLRTILPAEAFE